MFSIKKKVTVFKKTLTCNRIECLNGLTFLNNVHFLIRQL